jgi:hypothetical protein
MKEATVEQYLVERVEARGGTAEKVRTIGTRGFFDRLVVMPIGRVFFVELKRPRGGRLSPHQQKRIGLYRALGARVFLIKTTAEVDAFFAQIDGEKR